MADDLRDLFATQRQRALAVLEPTAANESLRAAQRRADALTSARALGLVKGKRNTTALRDTWMQVDDGVSVAAAELLDATAPAIGGAMRRRFVPFCRSAIDRWPVDTGTSRALMLPTLDVRDGEARAKLVNRARYAFYIRWGKGRRPRGVRVGGSPWVDLVRKPHREVADQITSDIVAAMEGR